MIVVRPLPALKSPELDPKDDHGRYADDGKRHPNPRWHRSWKWRNPDHAPRIYRDPGGLYSLSGERDNPRFGKRECQPPEDR
jgi:hypothetical protein